MKLLEFSLISLYFKFECLLSITGGKWTDHIPRSFYLLGHYLSFEYLFCIWRAIFETILFQFTAYPLQMRPLYHADQLRVDEGNDLLLSCQVRGRPTPLISWFFNDVEIKTPWKFGVKQGIIQTSRWASPFDDLLKSFIYEMLFQCDENKFN